MKNSIVYLFVLFLVHSACGNVEQDKTKVQTEEVKDKASQMIQDIEGVHQKESFRSFEAVEFDLQLTFGGKERFNGAISMTTNGTRVLMTDSSGAKLWDGEKALDATTMMEDGAAKFGLLTWSYFFAAPYKLSDPGTTSKYLAEKELGGNSYEAFKLSFGADVGDSPDDWYIVYKDLNSDLLAGMAYIVTGGGTSIEDAEKDPHLITYEAYAEISGIPFATQWNFWTWNDAGEMKKLLGSATVSNIKLIKKAGDLLNLTASNSVSNLES